MLIEQPDEAKKRQALDFASANWQQAKTTEAAATYGWVLYKLGQLGDAEKALEFGAIPRPDHARHGLLHRAGGHRRGCEARAKSLLENALKSTTPFYTRPDAQELLDKLKK